MSEQASCLYTGWVRHRRFSPVAHHFTYPIFMFYLDLDELPDLMASRWYTRLNGYNLVSFWCKDYFQSGQSFQSEQKDQFELRQSKDGSLRDVAQLKHDLIAFAKNDARCNDIPEPDISRVRMLTHLRYVNVVFNPVTMYYCFDEYEQLQCIVAEITNTPWDERHSYVLHVGNAHEQMAYQAKGRNKHRFNFDKTFHVSPFNPMEMEYVWNFSEPDHALTIHMDNLMTGAKEDDRKHFDATLSLKRQPYSQLARVLIRYPFMTVRVTMGIYWQALKLWLKKAPFYDHPKESST